MAVAAFRSALLALACAACASVAADSRAFENSQWRVTAINGRATPATNDYRLEFKNGRIGGRFGCNHLGGSYAVTGETLVAREIASTLMGCPEPAASFERDGLAVLNQPMRWTWVSGQTMTLNSNAGSIALERLP